MTTEMGKMPPPPSPAPSSSLAMVAERRPLHRPGGCTGVLFQLFDWNHHRLASKKLFSRRLLPQARAAKRISKKFSANEKMPPAKLLLIADENRGSFPSSKKADAAGNIAANGDRGKRMCSPNLVARLMGLDSMPTADGHGRPRKVEDGASTSSEGDGGGCCYFDGSDTSGSSRHCQDPGFEIPAGGGGRPPQKQRKTAIFDRLPDTTAGVSSEATLLFNRNLLARPRKSHPKPPPSPIRSPRLAGRTSSALLMEAAARILEPRMQSRSRGRPSLTFPSPYQATPESAQCSASPLGSPTELVGASSVRPCRNCGNQVGAPEEITEVSETSVMDSAPSSTSSDFSQTSSAAPKPPALPKKEIIRRNSMERKKTHQLNEPQVRSKPRRVAAVSRSTTPRQSTARPNELPSARAKASPPPKPDVRQRTRGLDPSSSSESRENLRNLSRARTRSMGGGRTEIERSAACEKKPLARKRRSTGSNIQSEEGAPPKQRSIAAGGVHNPRGSSGRRKTMEARDGGGGERSSDEATTASGSVTEETSGGPVRNPDETVDALSALLEQKIRELSDLGRDESVAGILEELISALTFAQTETQRRDYGPPADLRTEGGSDYGSSNLPECRSYQGPNLCVIEDFQVVQEEYDQPSPVSILESSFSNDGSSFSEKSFHSSSGHRLPMRFPENSDKSSSPELTADLSDSATSTIAGGTEPPPPPPSQFRGVGPRVVQSAGRKPNYVSGGGLISDADLLFGRAVLHEALESLVDALREGEGQLSGGGDSEQEFKLRRLLFDCILEHVDVNYGDHGGAGYRDWGKLPRPASQMLAREVSEEMEACRSMAGKGLDEVVGRDMGRMNGWWVDSDAEAFGAGAEIGNHLLQLLVDEVAFDLLLR